MSLNRSVLIGRLTKDPELRYTTTGTAVATFTLAVDRRRTNQAGERETDFIQVVTWQKNAELCAQYLKKGRQVGVEGRLQTRNYENNEGRRIYVVEVVAEYVQFLGGPRNEGTEPEPEKRQPDPWSDNPFADDQRPIDIPDDDLPF